MSRCTYVLYIFKDCDVIFTKDIQLEMCLIYNYDTLEVAHDTNEVYKEMRKKVFYSIAITTLLLVFSACSSNDDDGKKIGNVSKGIIGTWAVKNV